MQPLEYLRVLRRRWRIVLGVVALTVALATLTAPGEKPEPTVTTTYTATRTLISNGPQSGRSGNGPSSLAQAAFLLKVGEVPERVAERLDTGESAALLASLVTVESDPQLATVSITARGEEAVRAEALANAFGDELINALVETARQAQQADLDRAVARTEDLRRRIAALDAVIQPGEDSLRVAERDALINQYRLAYDSFQDLSTNSEISAPFSTIQMAEAVPIIESSGGGGDPLPAGRTQRGLLGLGAGLLLGCAAAIAVHRFDPRLSSKQQAEDAFALPVVSEVPVLRRRHRGSHVLTFEQPASIYGEAYRALRTAIMFVKAGPSAAAKHREAATLLGEAHTPAMPDLQVVLVTSPGPGEGKTTSVANLAASFAEAGQSVLVLSFDLRGPRIHKLLGVNERRSRGLVDVLRGGYGAPSIRDIVRPTSIPNVTLLPAGEPNDNPAGLLANAPDVIRAARRMADIVIIDTPPLLAANDAAELVPTADIVVVVARAGRTTTESADRASEVLERLAAPVLGVVLVATPRVPTSQRYYYRYQVHHEGRFGWRRQLRRVRKLLRRTPSRDPRSTPSKEPREGDSTNVPESSHGVPVGALAPSGQRPDGS